MSAHPIPFPAWERYAAAREFEFEASTGVRSRGPLVRARRGGIDLVIDLASSKGTQTRVVGRALDAIDVEVQVRPRSGFSRSWRALFGHTPLLDDAAFEDRYEIETSRGETVPTVLDAPVRAAITAFRERDILLAYRRGVVLFLWPHVETDGDVLDAACEVVVAVCRLRYSERVYR